MCTHIDFNIISMTSYIHTSVAMEVDPKAAIRCLSCWSYTVAKISDCYC